MLAERQRLTSMLARELASREHAAAAAEGAHATAAADPRIGLSLLDQALDDPVAIVGRGGVVLEANPAWLALHRRPGGGRIACAIGDSLVDAWAVIAEPDTADTPSSTRVDAGARRRLRAALLDVIESRRPRAEGRVRLEVDAKMMWFEVIVFAIGRGVRESGIRILDVSKAMASEAALRGSFEREQLALEFAELGTLDWQVDSDRIVVSALQRRMLGLEADLPLLDRARIRELVHPDDRVLFDEAIRLCLAGQAGLDVEFRVVRPDGSECWLHTKGNIESDGSGAPRRLLCLSQDITARKDAEERVRRIAHFDSLTGLPNRTLLRDRLQQAIHEARRRLSRVAVLFLDLDHFKSVNDSLGHQGGDALLSQVADRLRACTRESDTLCRHSGDEYLVVLSGIHHSAEVARIAGKIVDRIAEPYQIEGHELRVTASVGIAMYPEDGETIDALVRHADAAMYHAKGSGRRNYQFFTASMNTNVREKLTLAAELRRAVREGELRMFYQPQFDVVHTRLIGAEALVRWQHPVRGLMLPESFVPIAEESDLIIELGDWVLREVCTQIRHWRDEGLAAPRIAVNFSPLQFRQSNVVQTVAAALDESGLPAGLIEVELTENAIMSHARSSAETLEALHELGIGLAVDDFGTGYSSLSYLNRFPIDKLKIDRSFVVDLPRDRGAAAIVRAVINLGRNLNLAVVAEGVENDEQLAFLRAEGCHAFQGFQAGAPMPAEAFEGLLA